MTLCEDCPETALTCKVVPEARRTKANSQRRQRTGVLLAYLCGRGGGGGSRMRRNHGRRAVIDRSSLNPSITQKHIVGQTWPTNPVRSISCFSFCSFSNPFPLFVGSFSKDDRGDYFSPRIPAPFVVSPSAEETHGGICSLSLPVHHAYPSPFLS